MNKLIYKKVVSYFISRNYKFEFDFFQNLNFDHVALFTFDSSTPRMMYNIKLVLIKLK